MYRRLVYFPAFPRLTKTGSSEDFIWVLDSTCISQAFCFAFIFTPAQLLWLAPIKEERNLFNEEISFPSVEKKKKKQTKTKTKKQTNKQNNNNKNQGAAI